MGLDIQPMEILTDQQTGELRGPTLDQASGTTRQSSNARDMILINTAGQQAQSSLVRNLTRVIIYLF